VPEPHHAATHTVSDDHTAECARRWVARDGRATRQYWIIELRATSHRVPYPANGLGCRTDDGVAAADGAMDTDDGVDATLSFGDEPADDAAAAAAARCFSVSELLRR
jgi:hypothetical protein